MGAVRMGSCLRRNAGGRRRRKGRAGVEGGNGLGAGLGEIPAASAGMTEWRWGGGARCRGGCGGLSGLALPLSGAPLMTLAEERRFSEHQRRRVHADDVAEDAAEVVDARQLAA